MTTNLAKTWTKYDDNLNDSSLTLVEDQNREMLLRIKNRLVSSCGAVVVSSSDGTTADASDNWSVYTDLVFNTSGSAHSWIVLQFDSIHSGYQICIDCNETAVTTEQCTALMSGAAGFTGGTTTNRPTATDEITLINGTYWGGWTIADSSSSRRAWSLITSSDNTVVFVLTHFTNSPLGFWIFAKPAGAPAGNSTPGIAYMIGQSGPTVSNLRGSGNTKMLVDGQETGLVFSSSYADIDFLSSTQDNRCSVDISNNGMMFGHSLISTNVSRAGAYGYIPDLYWVNTAMVDYMHLYQSDGTSVGWCVYVDFAIPTPSIVER